MGNTDFLTTPHGGCNRGAAGVERTDHQTPSTMNAAISLLEAVLPTTVHLHTRVAAEHPSAAILGTERVGSGTVVDSNGLILTAHYIVLGASDIEVTLLDGTTIAGVVAARDFATGIALVRIAVQAHPAALLSPSTSVDRGEEVFVLAATGPSDRRVSNGVVMSCDSFDAYWEFSLDRAIATTATNPGFSGGALFDRRGCMLAVAALDLNEVGRATLGIPVEYYLDHRAELLRDGRRTSRPPRAWIGLYCYSAQDRLVVAGVLPGTPGEQAGLKPGDILLSINGERVSGRHTLYHRVWAHRPGDPIQCTIFRGDKVRSLTIEAGDAEAFFA